MGTTLAVQGSTSRYDAVGNAISTTMPNTVYSYDAAGNLDLVTMPNGTSIDYGYDSLNRLTTLVAAQAGGDKLFQQTYTLLHNGQRDFVIEKRYDSFGNGNSDVVSNVKVDWSYDALNRLTGETRDGDTTPGNGTDNFGTQDGSDYTDTYTLDLSGNRKTKSHDAVGTSADETITSSYDADDRLNSTTSTISGSVSYTYDANGSLTTRVTSVGTMKYVYDLRNRLVGFDANGDGDTLDTNDVTYGYDYQGQRTSKSIVGGSSTYFLVDGNNPTGYSQVLEESSTQGGSPSTSYLIGLDLIGQNVSGTRSYLLSDGIGSTNFKFTGEQYDSALGQYYLRARYYDPGIGRFSSFDRFDGDPQAPTTLHKYVYASDNPVHFMDRSGHEFTVTDFLVGTGLVAGGIFGYSLPAASVGEKLQHTIEFAFLGAFTGLSAAMYATALLPLFAVDFAAFQNVAMNIETEPAVALSEAENVALQQDLRTLAVQQDLQTLNTLGSTKGKAVEEATAARLNAEIPGIVQNTGVKVVDAAGDEITEMDMVTQQAIVECKSGPFLDEDRINELKLQNSIQSLVSNRPVVIYAPDMNPGTLATLQQEGYLITNNFKDLVDLIRPIHR